ncbi:MAG: hypothetical protein IKX19_11490, partial [Clostridia bacterium]|nr:hypothetical protein [Clostridia bacterium]
MPQLLRLHPKSYKQVKERIIFFFPSNIPQGRVDAVIGEIQKAKHLVVGAYRRNEQSDFAYNLTAGSYWIRFYTNADYTNFQIGDIRDGRDAARFRNRSYRDKVFTIIPTGEILFVHHVVPSRVRLLSDHVLRPVMDTEHVSWNMDLRLFSDLRDAMYSYFSSDDTVAEEDGEDKRVEVSGRFRANILRPFKEYTEKESWIELNRQLSGQGVSYVRREYVRTDPKGPVYRFFTERKAEV